MSQAPGLSGMPDSGHCSSAATSASCASSSASPTSRTIRATPAIILADSILQTASMVRWVSATVTATHHIIFTLRCASWAVAPLSSCGGVHARSGLVDLAKLALTVASYFEELSGQFDRLCLRVRLKDRKTPN